MAGSEMIADSMTKAKARKTIWQMLSQRQWWRLVYDPEFVASRKLNKREHERRAKEMSEVFLSKLESFAKAENLPWLEEPEPEGEEDIMLKVLRNGGDASSKVAKGPHHE